MSFKIFHKCQKPYFYGYFNKAYRERNRRYNSFSQRFLRWFRSL